MTAALHIGDRFRDTHDQSYGVLRVLGDAPSELVYVVQSSSTAPSRLLRLCPTAYATHPLGGTSVGTDARDSLASLELAWLQAAAKLELPTLSTAHEGGRSDAGVPYFLFATPPGESLAARVQRQGPLPAVTAIDVACQLGEALQALQAIDLSQPVLHPDAIYLDRAPLRGTAGGPAGALQARLICHGLRRDASPGPGPGQSADDKSPRVQPSVESRALALLLLYMLSGAAEGPEGAHPGEPSADLRAPLVDANVPAGLRRLLQSVLSRDGDPSLLRLPDFLRALRAEAALLASSSTDRRPVTPVRSGALVSASAPGVSLPLALPSRGSYVAVALCVAWVGGGTYGLLRSSQPPPIVGLPTPASAAPDLSVLAPAPDLGATPPSRDAATAGDPPPPSAWPPATGEAPSAPPASPPPTVGNPSPGPSNVAPKPAAIPSARTAKDAASPSPRFHLEQQFASSPVPPATRKAAREAVLSCLGRSSVRDGLPVHCSIEVYVMQRSGASFATLLRPPCDLRLSLITSLEMCISKELTRRALNPALRSLVLQKLW